MVAYSKTPQSICHVEMPTIRLYYVLILPLFVKESGLSGCHSSRCPLKQEKRGRERRLFVSNVWLVISCVHLWLLANPCLERLMMDCSRQRRDCSLSKFLWMRPIVWCEWFLTSWHCLIIDNKSTQLDVEMTNFTAFMTLYLESFWSD